MGMENVCGLFPLAFSSPPVPRGKRTHWDPLPINGQKGMNPKGKSVPAKNAGKNGGKSHNRKRSR